MKYYFYNNNFEIIGRSNNKHKLISFAKASGENGKIVAAGTGKTVMMISKGE